MPYVTFDAGTLPGFGTAYPSKDAAIAARINGQQVGFDATRDERAVWQAREAARFTDGTYTAVPWADRLRQIIGDLPPDRLDTASDARSDAGLYETFTAEEVRVARILLAHFAHVSVENEARIAFTPDDAFGHEDRQLRLTPRRYLDRYAAALWPDTTIDAYALTTRAAGAFRLARTADEIGRVYAVKGGPNSCMCREYHGNSRASWYADYTRHPARAYAGPDLAVAYLGSLHPTDPHKDRVTARAVVWPDRHVYTRCYGDVVTLGESLQAAGYTEDRIDGARLTVIRHSGSYLMPYVDGCETADRHGAYFVLRDDEDGEYGTHSTGGLAEEVERERYHCARCDEEIDESDTYCESCQEGFYVCEACDESHHEDDETPAHYTHGTLCPSCDSENERECGFCHTTWNEYDRPRRERGSDLCDSCRETVGQCVVCDEYTDHVDDGTRYRCADCQIDAVEMDVDAAVAS